MIFEPERRIPLPTKDLLSYVFDDPTYDQDEPVSHIFDLALYLTGTSLITFIIPGLH